MNIIAKTVLLKVDSNQDSAESPQQTLMTGELYPKVQDGTPQIKKEKTQ